VHAEFKALSVPFEKRVGRMLESLRLCKALWGEGPVDWDGLWEVEGAEMRPKPVQSGGPPIWGGGSVPGSLLRAGRYFDGWMPTGPGDPTLWTKSFETVRSAARDAGRDPEQVTGSLYATVAIADSFEAGEEKLMNFMRAYYGPIADRMRHGEACFGGPIEELGPWLQGFVDAGVEHMVIRFTGEHDMQMETVARYRAEMGW